MARWLVERQAGGRERMTLNNHLVPLLHLHVFDAVDAQHGFQIFFASPQLLLHNTSIYIYIFMNDMNTVALVYLFFFIPFQLRSCEIRCVLLLMRPIEAHELFLPFPSSFIFSVSVLYYFFHVSVSSILLLLLRLLSFSSMYESN